MECNSSEDKKMDHKLTVKGASAPCIKDYFYIQKIYRLHITNRLYWRHKEDKTNRARERKRTGTRRNTRGWKRRKGTHG